MRSNGPVHGYGVCYGTMLRGGGSGVKCCILSFLEGDLGHGVTASRRPVGAQKHWKHHLIITLLFRGGEAISLRRNEASTYETPSIPTR